MSHHYARFLKSILLQFIFFLHVYDLSTPCKMFHPFSKKKKMTRIIDDSEVIDTLHAVPRLLMFVNSVNPFPKIHKVQTNINSLKQINFRN